MYTLIKRTIDIFFSIFILLALSPFFVLISLSILIIMGSPVIFKQQRLGWKEKEFFIYKFRSMTDQKDSDGNLACDKVRLTSLGKFLRKTSLDEIPQFINVIKGDMSIIGPRPLFVEYFPYYSEREKKRHDVRPGITGLAQINGRNTLTWEDRLEWDVFYVENLSFLLDIYIFFKTIYNVLAKKDVVLVPGLIQGKLSDLRKEYTEQ